MVKFIAHRGNLDGVNLVYENDDAYLKHAYSQGYDVECDLIARRGILYYGHDEPQLPADLTFLQQRGVWCHAKNTEALLQLMKMRANYFWHESDKLTITSERYLWCYPNTHIVHPRAVWLDLLGAIMPDTVPKIYGICGDTVR